MATRLVDMPQVESARHHIDGEWLRGRRDPLPSLDPATGEPIGRYFPGDVGLADDAIGAARCAFEEGSWASHPRLRAGALRACAARLAERAERLAAVVAHENGKAIGQARREVAAAISEVDYYAGACRTQAGRMLEPEPGQYSLVAREPIGVAAVIVPWNAPVALLFRSLAAALAAGCTAVVKPAAQTSLSHALALDCLISPGQVPPGVVNSVNDGGIEVGERLVASADVDVVSFTGASDTGKRIMAAAAPTLKRVSLELGSKAPAIVFGDADLAPACAEIVRASLVNCGQQCVAASRILVQASCAAQVRARLSHAYGALRVGPGYHEASEVGALIDRSNRDRIESWLQRANEEGEILLRGRRLDGEYPGGAFLTPSLVAIDDPRSSLVQEELFGPLVCLETFEDEQDALERANATRYGLAASVFTRDLARSLRMARGLRAGTVWINAHGRLLAEAEMEGHGASGLGRMHGLDALGEFQQAKHIYLPFAMR